MKFSEQWGLFEGNLIRGLEVVLVPACLLTIGQVGRQSGGTQLICPLPQLCPHRGCLFPPFGQYTLSFFFVVTQMEQQFTAVARHDVLPVATANRSLVPKPPVEISFGGLCESAGEIGY